jgi:outer membrane autotransporter protein
MESRRLFILTALALISAGTFYPTHNVFAAVSANMYAQDPDFSYNSGDELVNAHQGITIRTQSATEIPTYSSYNAVVELGAEDALPSNWTDPDELHWDYHSTLLTTSGDRTINNVSLESTGRANEKLRVLQIYGGNINMDNVTINTDVENAYEGRLLEVTNIRVANSGSTSANVTINNLYLNSTVDFKDATQAAHNGVYALVEGNSQGAESVLNLTGDVFINTNLTSVRDAYDGEYAIGVSKNDAVSGKYGGVVNINATADQEGNIVDPDAKIQIFGNIDVKGGMVRLAMSGSDSVWYGAEVGGIVRDESTGWYKPRENSFLMLRLADGAQWVPDIMQTDDPAFGDESVNASYIGMVNLEEGGIINMHGLNKHTNAADTVDHLYIGKLNSDGGILRMDANGSTVDSTYRNGSDFVVVPTGSGTLYVQPIDGSKLEGITASNPVRIGDVTSHLNLVGLSSTSTLVEGTLYDYTPILEKNIVSTKFGTLADDDWYIVGVDKETTETTDTARSATALLYGDYISHRSIDTLNQRMGELRDYSGANDGVWVRWKTGEMESHQFGHYNYDWDFYQIGYDRRIPAKRGNWYVGGAYQTTNGDASYDDGTGDLHMYGGSLYAGWAGNGGEYMDYVLQYNHYKNKYTIFADNESASADYSTKAWAASVEYGKKFDIGNEWFFEPQTQLVYGDIGDADYTITNGVKVHQESMNSLIGRLGFRLGRLFRNPYEKEPNQFYLKFNVFHEFGDDKNVSLLGADSTTFHGAVASNDTWYKFGLGGKVTLGKNTALYGDVERSFGGDITTKWQFNAGLRWMF